MSLDIVWACFYGSGARLEGGRSTESGGDVGDAAEVAEISKKKFWKKGTYLSIGHCLGSFLWFWCEVGRWEVNREWW